MNALKDIDFHYCGELEVTYDEERPGCAGCAPSNDDEFDYCRCAEIIDAAVDTTSMRSLGIAKTIWQKMGLSDEVYRYALERHIARTPPDFEVRVEGGYYGQEIRGVLLDHGSCSALNELLALRPLKLIQRILMDEYAGELLPTLGCAAPKIRRVLLSSIVLPNERNRKKAEKSRKYAAEYIKELRDAIPIAVCTEDQGTFRVIDGYHRISAAKKTRMKEVMVIVLKTVVPRAKRGPAQRGRQLWI